jgi:hypothetical protein
MDIKKLLRISTITYIAFLILLGIFILIYGVFVYPNPNKLIYLFICFVLIVHGQMIAMISLVLSCLLNDQEILFDHLGDTDKEKDLKIYSNSYLFMN